MGLIANLVLVFVAGLITALATGLGALPFFFVEEFSDRWNVILWGLASGIMVSASVFGLIFEGLANGTITEIIPGLLAGIVLVIVASRLLSRWEFADHHGTGDDDHSDDHEADHADPHHTEVEAFVEGDLRKLLLILGVLTVHSFPEGVAIGVSFADLNLEGGIAFLGFAVPLLAIFMTVAISIHNIPEGVAISIPLQTLGVSRWRMVGAAVFSSLPQPIGAVIAFGFVRIARAFLPFGFGFAAGAMIFLVLSEFIPEALEVGEDLPNKGYGELTVGLVAGVALMVPLVFI